MNNNNTSKNQDKTKEEDKITYNNTRIVENILPLEIAAKLELEKLIKT